MEEVLDVYTLPEDLGCPLVYLDEACKQSVGETRALAYATGRRRPRR